jgi:hypothetical protein
VNVIGNHKYYLQKREAGRKGAMVRYEMYGNPGTVEGRRLGGIHSLKTHNIKGTGFKILRKVDRPKYSSALAELLGILIGDGHLSEYQATMITGIKTDLPHALYVVDLFKKIFRIKGAIKKRPNHGAVVVVVSSKAIVDLLAIFGMPQGNKLSGNLRIPRWVFTSRAYMKMFIRGLFDTDGCVFLDRHVINGNRYKHLGWALTSASSSLLADIRKLLELLDFHPTWRASQNSVYLRKQAEVQRYFRNIGSSNSKHLCRYKKFVDGRVPKRS